MSQSAVHARGLIVLLLLATRPATAAPAPAAAPHDGLQSSVPSAGDTLIAAPTELRLTFTGSVNVRFASVHLMGPRGDVELAALGQPDGAPRVVVARIVGPLLAGDHSVHWRIVSGDGHAVTGEFGFLIREDATGLAAPGPPGEPAAEPGVPPVAERPLAERGFHAGSPAFVAIRWLMFMALLGVMGAVAFRSAVLPGAAAAHPAGRLEAGPALERGAARVGLWSAVILLVAAAGRLVAQSEVIHGPVTRFDPDLLGTLLTGTLWGWGWLLQVAAGITALTAFAAARRGAAGAWTVALVAVVALGFTPGLSGHAAGAETWAPWPIVADGIHVLAAGGWLGGLLAVMLVALRARGRGEGELAAIVAAFSRMALILAGVLIATGVFSAVVHLPSLGDLWGTPYGRTLLVKLGLFLGVFATAAYNYLRVRPALIHGAGSDPLRRSGTAELAIAAAVLLVTAVLVATPTPTP